MPQQLTAMRLFSAVEIIPTRKYSNAGVQHGNIDERFDNNPWNWHCNGSETVLSQMETFISKQIINTWIVIKRADMIVSWSGAVVVWTWWVDNILIKSNYKTPAVASLWPISCRLSGATCTTQSNQQRWVTRNNETERNWKKKKKKKKKKKMIYK